MARCNNKIAVPVNLPLFALRQSYRYIYLMMNASLEYIENDAFFHLDHVLSTDTIICSCKTGCIVSLREDPMCQAILIEQLAEYLLPSSTQEKRYQILSKFESNGTADKYDLPYVFRSQEICDQSTVKVPLCRKATAHIFGLHTRNQQNKLLISPTEYNELSRQRRLSQLLAALASFLGKPPLITRTNEKSDCINWNHEVFSELFPEGMEKRSKKENNIMQSLTSKYDLNPFSAGRLLYAVVGQRRYDEFLLEQQGCHVVISASQHALLVLLRDSAPPSSSSKWSRVQVASAKNISVKRKSVTTFRKAAQVLYITLGGNDLQGTIGVLLKEKNQARKKYIEELIDGLEKDCSNAIANITGNDRTLKLTSTITSFLKSRIHSVQNPHYDFTENYLESEEARNIYLGFAPLTEDGMFLQVWKTEGEGTVLYIPFGSLLILPASTMHAGGYCSRARSGNLRLHFYFYLNGVTAPISNTNVYCDCNKIAFATKYLDQCENSRGQVKLSKLFSTFSTEEQKHCEKLNKQRKKIG